MDGARPTRPLDGDLLGALREICGAGHVLTDATTLASYRTEPFSREAHAPVLAVLPGDGAEVAAVLGACARAHVPWVARGAGTGLSGGARSVPGAVLIVLTRLTRILAIDLAEATVTVEPGVSPQAIRAAVGPTHTFGPDPASGAIAGLGGCVAENAGGPRSLAYGPTGDWVVGLDVVLADGSTVSLRREQPGYDLIGAFTGSEGTLGIAVAIHLRLIPTPESVRVAVACFDGPVAAARAASAIVHAGLAPTAMELLDAMAIRALGEVAALADLGLRADAGGALLIEIAGAEEDSAGGLEAVMAHCGRSGARDIRVVLDGDERDALWGIVATVFVAMSRLARAHRILDCAVPRSRLAETMERISALSSEFGLAVANVTHAGEGLLHPVICFDPGSPIETARARELADRILGVFLDAGGSIAGEHGIGVEKTASLAAMSGPVALAAFTRLRRAFDPHGLANPGKLLDVRG